MNLYEEYSAERKQQQQLGVLPDWFTTAGFKMFSEKYLYQADNFAQQARNIATCAAKHINVICPNAEDRFFELIWKGWLSCSTPVLANMGTDRGLPVSCSGQYIGDSIDQFYKNRHETAMLTKNGFGTSGYLGDIRSRGSPITKGGKASGILPVIRGFVEDMKEVSQGSARRGAWAGYLPIEHGDFDELSDYLANSPDDLNIGWCISNNFISKLNSNDNEALRRYQKVMKLKVSFGKGYFFFQDKANANRPQYYIDHNMNIVASNLCTEIMLHSSELYTYTCVLSSMNLAKYEEWKNTDAVYWATLFLDCVAQEFMEKAQGIPGLEKAISFTEKGRALGLGVCGFHTLLQSQMIPFESFQAHMFNNEIFFKIKELAESASRFLANVFGECEWMKGTGKRNTHLLAIAPTMSTALIMGGVSQGIEPFIGNCFTQSSAVGETTRINPEFLKIMIKYGMYNPELIEDINKKGGSVQHLNWLSELEKSVFKTAFEIDQRAILRLASNRQRFICQGQSINLFFSEQEDEEYISQIHQEAFLDPNILSLYYVRTSSKANKSDKNQICEACQ